MRVHLTKVPTGFVPSDTETAEWHGKLKNGQVVRGDYKRVRNYAFLKKYFALLTIAYDNWEPKEINSKYGVPEKNFGRFRADVTILAGFYDVTVRLDGTTRIEPKSISFASMTQEEFEGLYSATIDVLLKHVYDRDMDKETLDHIVNQYMNFV